MISLGQPIPEHGSVGPITNSQFLTKSDSLFVALRTLGGTGGGHAGKKIGGHD